MLFPTIEFGIFFLIVFTVSWAVRGLPEARKLFLVGASYFFYGWWDWRFLGLLFLSTFINYLAGLALARTERVGLRKFIVGVAVVAGLSILGFFKYYGFFLTSFAALLEAAGLERDLPFMQVILPVGISFFTFQGISYVVDVYRGHATAERSLVNVMLYISFFPQLVAGPIVRAADFLPQLHRPARLSRAHIGVGTVLILTGLAKKMVIANYLATELVDPVFFDPSGATAQMSQMPPPSSSASSGDGRYCTPRAIQRPRCCGVNWKTMASRMRPTAKGVTYWLGSPKRAKPAI